MPNTKELWGKVLGEIAVSVPRSTFITWFKNTEIVKVDDGVIHVGVPNEFVKEWLFSKYHTTILKYLREFESSVRGLEYTVSRSTKQQPEEVSVTPTLEEANTLPFPETVDRRDNINPRYIFDNFILGSFNEVAHAASQAVVRAPGISYNPFFVYGGTGLGKTHLIQAIGNQLKKERDELKIHYITSEKFSVEYTTAIQNARLNDFKKKFRSYDVLIVDDIQFLANKEKTQDELFHLFNTLHELNKQIIFSSDQHPNLIPGLADRIRSRFLSGMIANIDQPEYESRLAILKQKAHGKNFFPSEEVFEFIASSIQGNIRELEGVLNSLICQVQLKKRNITLSEVKQIIRNNTKQKKAVSVRDVIDIVSNFYDIDNQQIYEKTRRKEIVKPRQVVMYLLREDFSVSYPVIGQKLGGRDHTTVMHSCEKIKNDIKNDNTLYQEVEQLRSLL